MSSSPFHAVSPMCSIPTATPHFFFFNNPATTETYPLSLHDALPICGETVDPFPPHFLDQPILMDPVAPLHPSLRLRRTGSKDANAQFLAHATKLRHRDLSP